MLEPEGLYVVVVGLDGDPWPPRKAFEPGAIRKIDRIGFIMRRGVRNTQEIRLFTIKATINQAAMASIFV